MFTRAWRASLQSRPSSPALPVHLPGDSGLFLYDVASSKASSRLRGPSVSMHFISDVLSVSWDTAAGGGSKLKNKGEAWE